MARLGLIEAGKYEVVVAALRSTMKPKELERLVTPWEWRDEIGWGGTGLAQLAYDVVDQAEMNGHTTELLARLLAERPDRADLLVLMTTLLRGKKAGPSGVDGLGQGLERLVEAFNPFLDPEAFAHGILSVRRRVCRVEVGNGGGGTGFLVGPDLVLTNYHVVMALLSGPRSATPVRCVFDDCAGLGGAAPTPRAPVGLDPAWAIPNRPFAATDLAPDRPGGPAAHELDYALLRLAERVGDEAVGSVTRGWIDASTSPAPPPKDTPALIVQHPGLPPDFTRQDTMKLAFATPGFLGLDASGLRLRHRVNTEKGSSGAPVFDASFRLVGLHHNRGQLRAGAEHLVEWNQAIPLTAIRADLPEEIRARLVAPPG
jgi:hypothetical protein